MAVSGAPFCNRFVSRKQTKPLQPDPETKRPRMSRPRSPTRGLLQNLLSKNVEQPVHAFKEKDVETLMDRSIPTRKEALLTDALLDRMVIDDRESINQLQLDIAGLRGEVGKVSMAVSQLMEGQREILAMLREGTRTAANVEQLGKKIGIVFSSVQESQKTMKKMGEKVDLLYARSAIGDPKSVMLGPSTPIMTPIYPVITPSASVISDDGCFGDL
ncbi:hypothetical protein JRQ81_002671 [Phrynocephalus forsythii]|uniref:Uncharacterized protein n=1 Tax=Phrynocephalus forsythii TaxID=171643 RepID=A0A9Q0XIE5_9SAUR|nr:hypothetical protein JRQ81_002671 [Phrynocephalus forsythii]